MMQIANRLQKQLWIAGGFLFSAIGLVGYILPMMPGLVFFILAAICFAKGSRKFLRRIIGHPVVGPQIMDWKRGKGMTRKTKFLAIAMLSVSMLFSAFYMVSLDWVKYIILVSLVGIIIYILQIKTKSVAK